MYITYDIYIYIIYNINHIKNNLSTLRIEWGLWKPFFFLFKRCPFLLKLEKTDSDFMEKCISANAIANTSMIDSSRCICGSFSLPTYDIFCRVLSLSDFICTKIHWVCLLISKTAWRKRMFYYLFTMIYFVDSYHCPALEEE